MYMTSMAKPVDFSQSSGFFRMEAVVPARFMPRGIPMSSADFGAPKSKPDNWEEAELPHYPSEVSSRTDTAKEKRTASLMAIEGVEGVGTGQDAIGNEGVVVYVRDAEAAKRIPRTVDGLNVQVQVTGPINALKR
jgi:hypothetical protein